MNGVVKGKEREAQNSLSAEILSFYVGDPVERERDGASIGDNEKHSEEFKIALSWYSLSHAVLLYN